MTHFITNSEKQEELLDQLQEYRDVLSEKLKKLEEKISIYELDWQFYRKRYQQYDHEQKRHKEMVIQLDIQLEELDHQKERFMNRHDLLFDLEGFLKNELFQSSQEFQSRFFTQSASEFAMAHDLPLAELEELLQLSEDGFSFFLDDQFFCFLETPAGHFFLHPRVIYPQELQSFLQKFFPIIHS